MRRPAVQRAHFGSNTLFPGIADDLVIAMVWLKAAAHLYFITSTTSEADVFKLVQYIIGL